MLEAQGKEPPTMKEHTKAVLEACTGQLVALGLVIAFPELVTALVD